MSVTQKSLRDECGLQCELFRLRQANAHLTADLQSSNRLRKALGKKARHQRKKELKAELNNDG